MAEPVAEVLRAVLAGERPPRAVETLGLRITTTDASVSMRIDYPSPNPPVITFSLADLATGLLRATQHAEDPALWGAIVLMVDSFDFDDIDSGDGQLLLEGLYDLSNGGELSGETVEVAHRRATRA